MCGQVDSFAFHYLDKNFPKATKHLVSSINLLQNPTYHPDVSNTGL